MNFTEEQMLAITSSGKNIIVSAGAGSGKTAVLTERVKQKLLQGIPVNQLLILTFTNMAAKEMKERIRKAILKTPSLKEEADRIEGAYITTFDSFALSIVKKYHTNLNITDKIEITDDGIINLKKKELLDEIMEENYLSIKPDFSSLVHDFCLKDDEELKSSILKCYQKIELKVEKEEYLAHYKESLFQEEYLNQVIEEYTSLLKEKQLLLRRQLLELEEYFEGDFVAKLEDNFLPFLQANSYEEFLKGLAYKSITVPRNSDELGKTKKQALFQTAKEIKDLCIYSSREEMKEEILSTKTNVEAILRILIELDKRLSKYKKENDIYNFTDIAHLAIQVVKENKEIQEELRNSFQEILIDEYQDTSDTQEAFISLIERNNVYMVGDVKQSIYRFRNANPYIFKDKYDTYQDGKKGMKIDLLKNFRSRKEVLDNINDIFNLIMDDEIGGAKYQESHQMVYGNTSYNEEGDNHIDNHLDIITYKKENLGRVSEQEQEAYLIGMDIKKKVEEHYQVYDRDLKKLRNITYQDFVILLDKSKYFDLYKKMFEYLQIPLSIEKEESLKKEDDLLILKNLIQFLICIKEKNFEQEFKYSYLSLSRSFLFPTCDEEIFEVFQNQSFQETPLYQLGEELSKEMDTCPLSTYLLKVLDAFSYEEKLITVGNMKKYRIREEYFYQLCKDYERKGHTIYDFNDYLNQIFDSDNDLKFNMNKESNNSVKIMTIHKSKGLEFPICYFASFPSKFNLSDLNDKILYDNQYGVILPKVDEYYKDTIIKTLLKRKTKKEEISEKIRLLYVALTRAKEKMILVIPEIEEEVVPLTKEVKYSYYSFLTIIKSIYSSLLIYKKETNLIATKEYLTNNKEVFLEQEDALPLQVEEIKVEEEILEESHFSKSTLHLPTKEEKEVMDFGSKVHEILEMIDFNHYDLSKYPISNRIKEKIDAFIHSDFMKDKLSCNMLKEYEFIYEEENQSSHGIIDLLIEKEEEMIIVDYKLKNILEEEYDKQLNGYRRVIEEKTKQKTS